MSIRLVCLSRQDKFNCENPGYHKNSPRRKKHSKTPYHFSDSTFHISTLGSRESSGFGKKRHLKPTTDESTSEL